MKTNGAFYPWASRAELFNKVLQRERQEKIKRSTRFNEETWVLVILIVLLTIEWIIRKRIGKTKINSATFRRKILVLSKESHSS